jgi:hypothetical protein
MNTIVWLCTSAKCIYVCDYRVVSVKDTYIYKTTVEMTIILLTICRRGRSFPQPPIEPHNKTVGPNDTLGPTQRPMGMQITSLARLWSPLPIFGSTSHTEQGQKWMQKYNNQYIYWETYHLYCINQVWKCNR